MARQQVTDGVIVGAELLLVAVATFAGVHGARLWVEHDSGEVAEDGGDPDGDSIGQVIEFLGGAAAFVVVVLLVVTFELLRRRQRAARSSAGPHYSRQVRASG